MSRPAPLRLGDLKRVVQIAPKIAPYVPPVPTMAPLEALTKLRAGPDPLDQDGFHYYRDGPMFCPTSVMTPFARRIDCELDHMYTLCVEGPEDITESTRWVYVEFLSRRIHREVEL